MDTASAAIIIISMFGDFPCGNTTSLREEIVKRGVPDQHRIDYTLEEPEWPFQAQVLWEDHPEIGSYTLYISTALSENYDGCVIEMIEGKYEDVN